MKTQKSIIAKLVLEGKLSKEELKEIVQNSVKKTTNHPYKITNLTNCYALISRDQMSKNDFANIKDSMLELLNNPLTELEQKIYAVLITGRAYKNHLMDKTDLEKFMPELKKFMKSNSDIENSVATKALGEISLANGLNEKDYDEIYTALTKNLDKGNQREVITRLEGVSSMLKNKSFHPKKEFLNYIKKTAENIGEIEYQNNKIIFLKTISKLNFAGIKFSKEFLKPIISSSLCALSQKPEQRNIAKYLHFFVSCKYADALDKKQLEKINIIFKKADKSDEIINNIAIKWKNL